MLLDLIELAGNRALSYAPGAQTRLERLHGKTMVLTIKPVNQSLAVTPQKEGVEFSQDVPDSPDVRLTATLGALLKISRSGLEDAELAPGDLSIDGDPIIGQRFAQLIAELDIDWHELLSDQVGEGAAHAIQASAAEAKHLADGAQAQLKTLAKRLLTDEFDLVPSPAEVEDVLDGIDDVRAAAERLQQRLERLKRALTTETD